MTEGKVVIRTVDGHSFTSKAFKIKESEPWSDWLRNQPMDAMFTMVSADGIPTMFRVRHIASVELLKVSP